MRRAGACAGAERRRCGAALLGGELDELAKAEEERKKVAEQLVRLAPQGASMPRFTHGAQERGQAPVMEHKLFQTLYEYRSEDPDDLEFDAGEILQVTDWEDEWFEGSNQQGKSGTFPASYVREIKAARAPKVLGAGEG